MQRVEFAAASRMEFEFEACERDTELLRTYVSMSEQFNEEVAVNVLDDLCPSCKHNAQMAMQGGE